MRFSEGVRELVQGQRRVLLEVGPGQGLTAFVKQHPDCDDETARLSFATLPGAYHNRPESAFILETLGKLWMVGQHVDWSAFYTKEVRHRVPLPTYPFERQRYWVDLPDARLAASRVASLSIRKRTSPNGSTCRSGNHSVNRSVVLKPKPRTAIALAHLQRHARPRFERAEQLRRDGQDVFTVYRRRRVCTERRPRVPHQPASVEDYKSSALSHQ